LSNRAITWALHQKIPATPKLVLLVLANAANDKEGLTCWRSHSLLAAETSLNRTTVIHTVQDLIRNTKIEKVGTKPDGSIIYRVLVAHDNQGWLRKTTSGTPQPVAHDNQGGCAEQLALVAEGNRGGCVGQHITKETKVTTQKPKKSAAAEDPRRAPFIAFVHQSWPTLVTDGSDFKALKDLLASTKEKPQFTLEMLQEYWNRFLNSHDDFHRRQGKPLRYFCTNINAFVGNGNGTHAGGGRRLGGAFAGALPYKPKQ
jgi:hypothetical protein